LFRADYRNDKQYRLDQKQTTKFLPDVALLGDGADTLALIVLAVAKLISI
jgi:hypothetical protein